MKKPVLALAVSFMGATTFNPNVAKAVDLPGGAAFITCNKIGTGTYVAPWSFESYNNTPIFGVRVRTEATDATPSSRTYFFLVPPTFDYEDQFLFSSNSRTPFVRLRGSVLTPQGAISTNTPNGRIPVNASCPSPLP